MSPKLTKRRLWPVSVRELVEFVWRTGDLGGRGDFVGPMRALEGTRGHQRLQKSRPNGYQTEVGISHLIPDEHFVLEIKGRIDGVLPHQGRVLLEEIKTVGGGWDGVANLLHWAQAKVYGFIYSLKQGLSEIDIQLTYLDLDSNRVTEFREPFTCAELGLFFEETIGIYLGWIRERHHWCRRRDESISGLGFPFPAYRHGQRELAVAAYRTLAQGGRLFVEAPTGIGKTISVLFPAVKALSEGAYEKIFYLTAKTVGRLIAEKAIAELRQAGLHLRAVTLTAREKLCVIDGKPCETLGCPFAVGYYDRIKPALRDALAGETFNRAAIAEVAQQHTVCPFELSLDLAVWSDAVICDYNHVFDPQAHLRRFFADDGGEFAFLIDEAHNLVDRAREMFSAELDRASILEVKRAVHDDQPACARALNAISSILHKLRRETGGGSGSEDELDLGFFSEPPTAPSPLRSAAWVIDELPASLVPLLGKFLEHAELWLARNKPAVYREPLRQLYFQIVEFLRTAEVFDERHAIIVLPHERLRLFCIDPSRLIARALKRGKAAVFFSATLAPLEYFREILGGNLEDPVLRLPSPFPPENLELLVEGRVATSFKARASTYDDVARAIAALVTGRPGNYFAYFPSYRYLDCVFERFRLLGSPVRTLVQRATMSEAEREAYLGEFHADRPDTLVGFAVMGGIFGEGIDLVGERLVGVIIVGVGLPQLSSERDLIRGHFQGKNQAGFDYAYLFPGMSRVLQAVGRLIRSETDRGVALLIDRRFGQMQYRRLFPSWWRPAVVSGPAGIAARVQAFWQQEATGSISPTNST